MTQDLAEAATVLAEVLEAENAALKRLDFSAAGALVSAKEAAMRRFAADRAGATPDADPVIADVGRRLNGLAAENRTLLERAITVQTRIVGIILQAAAPPAPVDQYSANGCKCPPRRPPAIALSARV